MNIRGDNWEEMHKFLETYNLPRSNHEEIENWNGPITGKEIESVTKNFQAKKSSDPDDFTGVFHQTFKEELVPDFAKLFQQTEEEGTLSNSFCNITLIPKPDEDTTWNKY